jgi:NADPH:quinone reductase-like Zn-dependent oxidoreductase
MAQTKKPVTPADESFLTTAAQAIGSTLGQLAKKAGVVAPAKPASKKVAAKKKPAPLVKKKAPVKKKAAAKKAR